MKEKNEAFENIEKELGRLKAETDKIDATLKLLEMCREQRDLIVDMALCIGRFMNQLAKAQGIISNCSNDFAIESDSLLDRVKKLAHGCASTKEGGK